MGDHRQFDTSQNMHQPKDEHDDFQIVNSKRKNRRRRTPPNFFNDDKFPPPVPSFANKGNSQAHKANFPASGNITNVDVKVSGLGEKPIVYNYTPTRPRAAVRRPPSRLGPNAEKFIPNPFATLQKTENSRDWAETNYIWHQQRLHEFVDSQHRFLFGDASLSGNVPLGAQGTRGVRLYELDVRRAGRAFGLFGARFWDSEEYFVVQYVKEGWEKYEGTGIGGVVGYSTERKVVA